MGKQYELYVQKGQPVWKIFTNILFSHVGMFILVIGYCVGGQILELEIQWDYTQVFDAGAYVFMYLEEEREELARLDKEAATMVMFLIKSYLDRQQNRELARKYLQEQTMSVCVFAIYEQVYALVFFHVYI